MIMGGENAMAEPHKIYLNFYPLTFFNAVFGVCRGAVRPECQIMGIILPGGFTF